MLYIWYISSPAPPPPTNLKILEIIEEEKPKSPDF
jgi:hypothetical protein